MDHYEARIKLREFERRLTNCADTDEVVGVRRELLTEMSAVEQQLSELEGLITACGDAREKARLRNESARLCKYLDGLEALSE